VAVLIATKDGANTIAETIASARAAEGIDVYVVSDGSTDDTAATARAAGATVLELEENIGKPGAVFRGLFDFGLTTR
jgi:glycosyltransferase involved in cell wall biosynthesis